MRHENDAIEAAKRLTREHVDKLEAIMTFEAQAISALEWEKGLSNKCRSKLNFIRVNHISIAPHCGMQATSKNFGRTLLKNFGRTLLKRRQLESPNPATLEVRQCHQMSRHPS